MQIYSRSRPPTTSRTYLSSPSIANDGARPCLCRYRQATLLPATPMSSVLIEDSVDFVGRGGLFALLGLTLVACGGGGGSAPPPAPTPPTPTNTAPSVNIDTPAAGSGLLSRSRLRQERPMLTAPLPLRAGANCRVQWSTFRPTFFRSFIAPDLQADTVLEFELEATDNGGLRGNARVSLTVRPTRFFERTPLPFDEGIEQFQ